MLELLRMILASDFGSFGVGLGLVLLVGIGIYKVTGFVKKIEYEHGGFCKKVENLDTNTDKLVKDMAYIKGSLDILRIPQPQDLFKAHSPVSLTEHGKNIAKEIGAEEIISRNWNKIFKKLEKDLVSKNAYDIQQYCVETASVEAELFFDKEGVEKIKNFSFSTGQPFQLYARMMGIIIRDKFLSLKGIDKETHIP